MRLLKHDCPDGTTYEWLPRTEHPKMCPRCHARLDKVRV